MLSEISKQENELPRREVVALKNSQEAVEEAVKKQKPLI
jgi:hypothetical protein